MNNTQDAYKRFYNNVNQSVIIKGFYDLLAWYFIQNYKKNKKD